MNSLLHQSLQRFFQTVLLFFLVTAGISQPTLLLSESFETGSGTTPPSGWASEQVTGTTLGISFVSTGTYPTLTAAFDGSKFVRYNSFNISSGSSRLKRNVAISTLNKSFITVEFAWYEDPGYAMSNDKVEVQWSADGTTWTTAASFSRYNNMPGWKWKRVLLPQGADNQPTVYISFLFSSAYGNNCSLDMVRVNGGPAIPPAFAIIGTGTTTVGYPYYTFYMGSRTQMLYTAGELTAAGAGPGNLTSIGLNVATAYPQVMQNFTIKMAATTASTLPGWTAAVLNTLYQVNYGVPATGWQDITLTNPFVWDGTSNIVVEICFGNNGSYTSNTLVYGSAVPERTWHYHADNYAGCTGTSAGSIQSVLPNIRFGIPPTLPGMLMGSIRDIHTNAPIAGAIVSSGTHIDTTDMFGSYSLYHLQEGVQTVQVTATGYVNESSATNIVQGTASILDFQMVPGPVLMGTVVDGSTGDLLTGASIFINGQYQTQSVIGGAFTTPQMSLVGNSTIMVSKPGFENFTGNVNLYPDSTSTINITLLPEAVAPGSMTASLNLSGNSALLNWEAPRGTYLLIYDDGIQDNFAVWTTANNLNALKFTPLNYPVNLMGGTLNLGTQENYDPDAMPLENFMVYATLANGPGGAPGTILDSTQVNPTGFGWINFSFSIPITINSGDFFLVMKQAGVPPHAAGIAMDMTTSFRSYSRFATGNGPWVPISGTFLLRALVQGAGGPLMTDQLRSAELISTSIPDGLTLMNPMVTATGTATVAKTASFEWNSLQTQVNKASFTIGGVHSDPAYDQGPGSTATGIVEPTETLASTLFDNGPIATSSGTGFGGADESFVQAPLTFFGSNLNKAQYYRIADDFSVSGNSWNVTSIEFYCYQTGSSTTSTITAAFCRIFNGDPGLPQTSVVWGDTSTNRLTNASFSNIYRVNSSGNTQRPIMKIVMNTPGLSLPAGNYWIEFSALGSLTSGPWCPYVTLNNTPVTGNGLQFTGSSGGYLPINSTYGQGVPFRINGTLANPGDVTYQVWRLLQGEEGNTATWNSIYTGYLNATIDNSWPLLPSGPYRWAVRAIYTPPGLRYSSPAFSNVIGKNWLASSTFCVNLSCNAHTKEGTMVRLVNKNYPDTAYTAFTNSEGCVTIQNIWKGNYTLSLSRFEYDLYSQTMSIMDNGNYNFTLHHIAYPPTNLAVNSQTLLATWSPPRARFTHLDESFNNGFTGNGWEVSGGTNWSINTGTGNPLPSAQFTSSPQVYNYHQYLTSKSLAGEFAPQMSLQYDIYLDNFATTYLNNLAVELWDGATWTVLKTYSNFDGSFPWTTEFIDISTMRNNPAFRFRFHASGVDSYDINTWIIDNVKVISSDGISGPNPCIIGYNFMINDVVTTVTNDTVYSIPPEMVPFGQSYNICVTAQYDSDISEPVCASLQSGYLYPAQGLTVDAGGCNAILEWKKPVTINGDPPGLSGYNIYVQGQLLHHNPDKDSLSYIDAGRDPGYYTYEVKAVYDLTPYGFPGQTAESLGNSGGSQTVRLMCGMPLPFFEPWDEGSFSQNNWQYNDHWTVNPNQGISAPCADFQWDPLISNYVQSITSPFINAGEWTCMDLWLDFDVKLIDRNQTGHEKLAVEIFFEGQWAQKEQITNSGSFDWVHHHLKINSVRGKGFKVRFTATGANSLDLLHWYVDNIHVYGVCKPALDLVASQNNRTTTLTWQAPECSATIPNLLVGLSQWSGAPANGYFQNYNYAYGVVYNLIPYPEASLSMIDFHHASYGISGIWNYKVHVVDWNTFTEIAELGPFSTKGDDRWEKSIPLGDIPNCGGKLIGIMLEPMSNTSSNAYPCFSADNLGPDGVSVFGALPAYSSFGPSAIGDFLQNLWIEVPDNEGILQLKPEKINVNQLVNPGLCRNPGGKKVTPASLTLNQNMTPLNDQSDHAVAMDYNVYRTGGNGMPPYIKLNSTPITIPQFTDIYPDTLENGTFRYFVTTRYSGTNDSLLLACEPSSDTITVRFPDLHFDPVWFGTPVDPMTIMVMEAYVNNMVLSPGDEISIFDGELCIGTKLVSTPPTPFSPLSIIASRDNPDTPELDGFTQGHTITYKIWKKDYNLEVTEISHYFPFAPMFAYETFVPFQTTAVNLNGNVLPVSLQLQGLTIHNGEYYCYDATATITVAGNGTIFQMQPGSNVSIIAGQKIRFLPGTRVMNGAYLHGYISPNGPYCYSTSPIAPVGTSSTTIPEKTESNSLFIYPNPSNGMFKVVFQSGEGNPYHLTLLNLSGEKILDQAGIIQSRVEIDIQKLPAGIYILQIRSDQINQVRKIIKF